MILTEDGKIEPRVDFKALALRRISKLEPSSSKVIKMMFFEKVNIVIWGEGEGQGATR